MSQNKKLLQFISEQMNKPTKPKVPRNQWQHPGETTVIPSRHITMKGVTYPVVGVDANGLKMKMLPGRDYSFTKGPVTEYPMMQAGGQRGGEYVDSVLNANKDLDWVKRLYEQNTPSMKIKGQKGRATHFMESGDNRVYPTIVRMPDGRLKYLGRDAYGYADSTNTFIQFPTEQDAQWFGRNYKKGRNVLKEFQPGGRVPIYTENPNDPRIKAYQDSLSLYKSNPPTEFLKQALKQGTYAKSKKPIKGNGIQPIFIYDPVIEVMNSLSSAGLPYAMWQPAITKENKNLYYQDSDGIVRDIKSGNVIVIKSHVYKKPVQPVVFRKPQPKAKEVVSTPLLPTSVATEIPTSVSPKAKPEEKKTQYSFTYPTFDKDVQKTIYFPTQKALIEFTDKYGYISREFRDSSGSATGYYTPEYKNGGILHKAQYGPPATSFGPIIPFRRNNQNGDIGTYYPQIGRSYRQDQMMKMALEEKRRREMERNIANTRQTYLKPAGTTQRTPDEIAAMNRERLRAQVQQNSPLAQTMGLFTPKGNNPEAGRVGAEMFANMNPIITSQVLSALRLNDLGKGKNPYGFGNGLFSNVLGGIGLLGDAFNLNALKSLKPSGIQSNYQVNTMVGKASPTQSSYKIYTLGVDPSTAGTIDPIPFNIYKSNNNYASAPKNINLPYGVGDNIAKGGAFNEGVFTFKNDPNQLLKLESIKRMVDMTGWDDYSKYDFVNSMKNIQDPRIGRVVKQIDINPDIRGLYVSNVPGISMQKASGRMMRKAITKDNIHDLFKKIKDVTRNNLTFDFVGENYNIDPKTGRFGIYDISPVIPESVQKNHWGSQHWMEHVTGDIHLKGLDDQARRASSQNIHKALYDKIFTDMRRAYMRNVGRYTNSPTVSPDRLKRYADVFENRLKDNFNAAFSTLDLNDPNIYYTKGGLVKYQTAGMVNIPAIANNFSDDAERREKAKRVVELARQRVKDDNWVAVPESIANTEWSKKHGANSCIGGVCTVLNEAGVIPNVIWSNTEFAKKAGNLGFNKDNRGWGLKGIQNLEPGDVVQYLHGEPGHAQIFLGVNNETGEYEFFDNFRREIRTYDKKSVEEDLDPLETDNRSGMQIWKVNPYHAPIRPAGKTYDKDADRLIRQQRSNLKFEKDNDFDKNIIAYQYKLREDSPYNKVEEEKPAGINEFLKFANDRYRIEELLDKIYQAGYPSRATREQIHDSLLNVFGILGQENKWENPWVGGDISPSWLPRVPLESTIEKTFSPKSLSIGPGQIKYSSINPRLRKVFGIEKPEDLQLWHKVIPLMVGLDIANKQWMENQGERFSERIIGKPGLSSQQMKWSEGRLSPYFYRGPGNPNIRKQLAQRFDNSLTGRMKNIFMPNKIDEAREKYISENIRDLQKVFDQGSYGKNVFDFINSNLERNRIDKYFAPYVIPEEERKDFPIDLPKIVITGKKKQFGGAHQYKNGGQYGGLDRWFAEKWVDVKTGKECGRQEGEDRKYPACRPSKRISNDTPKTASELSPAERQKFISSKTSSERINYQHRRK